MALLEPIIVKLKNDEAVNICHVSFRIAKEKLKSVEMNVKQIALRRKKGDKTDGSDADMPYIEEDRPLPSSHAVIETESGLGGGPLAV